MGPVICTIETQDVRVTVLKLPDPRDVFEKAPAIWEEPTSRCAVFAEGRSFTSKGGAMPFFCEKDRAVVACPDGMRSVIFLVERAR